MKIIKRITVGILSILIICTIGIGLLYKDELRSLYSIKKVDNYPMYQMKYYGDYGFDDFLKTGAEKDSDIEKFVTKKLTKGFPVDFGITEAGCTAFTCRNEKGQRLFCRNFDFGYAPSMQIETEPKNGYKSISTANLTFAGYNKDNLPKEGINLGNYLTLAAPYIPFDGLNEKGVAMALLAVPKANCKFDKNKITLNTTTTIRLVLDKAKNVEEAVELLKKYNIYFSAGVECHYLIADSEGNSVVVEYWDGKMQTIKPVNNYQIVTNFILYNNLNLGEGGTEFERYDKVDKVLKDTNGMLTQKQAEDLLVKVGCYGDSGEDKLQWSVIYNLTTGESEIFAHRHDKNIIKFKLN